MLIMSNPIKEARETAWEAVQKGVLDSLAKVQIEQHGKGCGCLQCQNQVVDEYNSWVDFLGPVIKNPDDFKFRVENERIKGGKT